MTTSEIPLKTKTRHAFISVMNFVRVKLLDKPELDTPEKRQRDEMEMKRAFVHFDKIRKNIMTCGNKLQVDTVEKMMEQFNERYGYLCYNKYIELREMMNKRKDELCMYI